MILYLIIAAIESEYHESSMNYGLFPGRSVKFMDEFHFTYE